MKKVVIFGGGTGLSCILSGLKLFPIDVTTVIAVSDMKQHGEAEGRAEYTGSRGCRKGIAFHG